MWLVQEAADDGGHGARILDLRREMRLLRMTGNEPKRLEGYSSRMISSICSSCAGLTTALTRATTNVWAPWSTRRRILARTSSTLSGTSTSPRASTRSCTPTMRLVGTKGSGRVARGRSTCRWRGSPSPYPRPRLSRMPDSKPMVTSTPIRGPLRSMSALVRASSRSVPSRRCRAPRGPPRRRRPPLGSPHPGTRGRGCGAWSATSPGCADRPFQKAIGERSAMSIASRRMV